MYLRFNNNPANTWEIKQTDKKITATYRGRLSTVDGRLENITHPERNYRLWKMFNLTDPADHLPDAVPLMYHMYSQGYGIITKIRDSKYVFEPLPE